MIFSRVLMRALGKGEKRKDQAIKLIAIKLRIENLRNLIRKARKAPIKM
jgi:hypothetical protein